MEVSTQQTGFGCYGSYDSRPSFSMNSQYYEEQYDEHPMSYTDCESTGHDDAIEAASSSESSASETRHSLPGEYEDDPLEDMELDDAREIDQNDVYELAASTEMLRIRFPFQSISIRLSDFCCLQEKDLLNDTIVDFYLNHIVEHVLPDDPARRVTVLPSVFWHNLSLLNAASQDEESQKLPPMDLLDLRFRDVLEFVEGFDLQEVDYVVIPVNEWDHWSLAVVCHPFKSNGRLICFDSKLTEDLNNRQNIATLIDNFFKYAWLRWRGEPCKFSLPLATPFNLPQQTNNVDAGVFILEFARRFLLAPPAHVDLFDFSIEYKDFAILNTRQDIQRAILSLCSNRATWEPVMALLARK